MPGADHTYPTFAAFLDDREDRVETGHLGTARDADLIRGVFEIVVGSQLGGERLAQFRNTAGRGVFRASLHQGLHGGFLDEGRCVDFRLAAGERVNLFSSGLHRLGLGRYSQREGWGNLGNAG